MPNVGVCSPDAEDVLGAAKEKGELVPFAEGRCGEKALGVGGAEASGEAGIRTGEVMGEDGVLASTAVVEPDDALESTTLVPRALAARVRAAGPVLLLLLLLKACVVVGADEVTVRPVARAGGDRLAVAELLGATLLPLPCGTCVDRAVVVVAADERCCLIGVVPTLSSRSRCCCELRSVSSSSSASPRMASIRPRR